MSYGYQIIRQWELEEGEGGRALLMQQKVFTENKQYQSISVCNGIFYFKFKGLYIY